MIDPETFADRQMELATEFAKYLIDHPDVDDLLPPESYIYFQVEGEPEFNQYSQQLAERRKLENGMIPVCIHLKGLAPRQRSRLIDPRIVSSSNPGSLA
jgi:hypothetical protein